MLSHYSLIALATLLQFILGAVWYSPLLFGRFWMDLMDHAKLTKEQLQAMQKAMMPFYVIQLALTFLTSVSFANLLPYISSFSAYHIAFWIWIGFIAPIQIGTVLWGKTARKFWLKQILVMISYQFISIMLLAWLVG